MSSSTKNHTISATVTTQQETRLVLKPIMSTTASKNEPYVPCIRGKHALGELVLVEPKEETHAVSVTPEAQKRFRETPTAMSMTPTPTASTPGSSPRYRKRGKRINRRWANSRGREWKAATASPTVVHSPSLTVAMQPELDDVEGLLFVSFSSKVNYCNEWSAHISMSAKDLYSSGVVWGVPSPPPIHLMYWVFTEAAHFPETAFVVSDKNDFGCTAVEVILSVYSWMFLCVTGSSWGSRQGQASQ